MSQPVLVEALMSQRYNGQQRGRGDQFDMTESDAADAVAIHFVRRVKKPVAVPKSLPVVTRDMPPEGKPPADVPARNDESQADSTADAPPADADDDDAKPAVAGRHGGSQQPYQNRNTHTRGSGRR